MKILGCWLGFIPAVCSVCLSVVAAVGVGVACEGRYLSSTTQVASRGCETLSLPLLLQALQFPSGEGGRLVEELSLIHI